MNTSSKTQDFEGGTEPTVKPGLGYPADRVESSPTPTGWQVGATISETDEIINVSRETKS